MQKLGSVKNAAYTAKINVMRYVRKHWRGRKMNNDILKYCMRGIVQYLDGNIDKFNSYKNKAMNIYKNEHLFELGDLIPQETKIKLYEMVS